MFVCVRRCMQAQGHTSVVSFELLTRTHTRTSLYPTLYKSLCACACVCACMRACVCVCSPQLRRPTRRAPRGARGGQLGAHGRGGATALGGTGAHGTRFVREVRHARSRIVDWHTYASIHTHPRKHTCMHSPVLTYAPARVCHRHSDFSFPTGTGCGGELRFAWAPYVTNASAALVRMRATMGPPHVLLLGAGLWDVLWEAPDARTPQAYGAAVVRALREALVRVHER